MYGGDTTVTWILGSMAKSKIFHCALSFLGHRSYARCSNSDCHHIITNVDTCIKLVSQATPFNLRMWERGYGNFAYIELYNQIESFRIDVIRVNLRRYIIHTDFSFFFTLWLTLTESSMTLKVVSGIQFWNPSKAECWRVPLEGHFCVTTNWLWQVTMLRAASLSFRFEAWAEKQDLDRYDSFPCWWHQGKTKQVRSLRKEYLLGT